MASTTITRPVEIYLNILFATSAALRSESVPSSPPEPGLTMREMSARSGINEATLRMWEVRHGFPSRGGFRAGTGATRRVTSPACARWSARASAGCRSRRRSSSPTMRRTSSRPRCTRRCARASRARAAAPVQASDAVDVARDRGRVPGPSRATAAVRLLPARALLPQRPRAGGASSRARPSARWCWPTSRAPARPESGPDRGPDRARPIPSPGSGRSCASRRASARA